jgi:tetratricopeptide (TPR) repeat protein
MGPAFPVSEPVVYVGWYSKHPYGPFARERFRFQRGAVAYHIHSAGGKSIRSRKRYWMGPLITLGAAATMGAVAEPYLSFTPDLAIFSDRLCRGYTFGEAAGMSMRVVSWQTALAGDPLYRPFKYTLDQQIAHLQADQRPEVVWAWIRKVNLLLRAGHFQQAVDYTRQCITERDHPVLQEKLGDLYAGNDMYEEAVTAYRQATAAGPADETMVRVGRKWVDILRQTGQDDRADEVAARIRANLGESVLLDWLEPMK